MSKVDIICFWIEKIMSKRLYVTECPPSNISMLDYQLLIL